MKKQYITPLCEDIKLEALMAESKILGLEQPSVLEENIGD